MTLLIGVFTRLQAALFAAFAALAAPGESATQPDGAPGLRVPAGDEVTEEDEDASERRKEWRCWDDDEQQKRGYCLARCDDDDFYRVLTNKIRVRGNRDFCQRIARKSCKRRGDTLRDWCFGSREAARVPARP